MGQQPLGSRDGVQSLVKGFLVLETIVEKGGRSTITELVDACQLPVGTVHRLVRTLVDVGYLRQEASRGYSLGSRVLFLADMAPSILNRVAMPDLQRIASALGETVMLVRIDADDALCIAQAPGSSAIRHFVEVGQREPAFASAGGKAILAHWESSAVRALFERRDPARSTQYTIRDSSTLLRELAEIRAERVSYDRREHDPSVAAVAVPVPQTTVRTAVVLSAPAERLTEALVEAALPQLRDLAAQLATEFCRPASASAAPVSLALTTDPTG